MSLNSKRIKRLKNFINKSTYNFDDGINLLLNCNSVKFIESVELHINLNINFKNNKEQIKSSIILPNSIDNNKKIAIFTEQDQKNLINLDVYKIGFDNLLNEILLKKIKFDILLTDIKSISKLSSASKILGMKGLMPSLKNETITNNFEKTVKDIKKGKVNYKSDKYGNIHLIFGKTNFKKEQLKENLFYILENIKKNKPSNVKGRFFKSINICTSMSPSIKLNIN